MNYNPSFTATPATNSSGFDIREFTDKLEQNDREKTKFVCPVCNGHNLSINMKDGKFTCYDDTTTEHRSAIAVHLLKTHRPFPNVPQKPLSRRELARKEAKEKSAIAAKKSSEIQQKADELAAAFDPDYRTTTEGSLTIEMTTWAKEHGHDSFAATRLLKERIDFKRQDLEIGMPQSNGKKSKQAKESSEFHDIEESKIEIQSIEGNLRTRLDLSTVLPPRIASHLKSVAEAIPTAPEALFTTFLATIASLIGTSSEFSFPTRGWSEPSVIWSMIVAPTGKLKTPAQKTLIRPLKSLQQRAGAEYKKAHKTWQASRERAEKENQPFDDVEPTQREFMLSDATIEALAVVHSENPRGFLRFQDEIDGFYGQLNKYRNGGGDDEQNWLSLNSGQGIKVNRMTRRLELYSTAISMTGSIQPETISAHTGGKRDSSGMNSRWLYCAVPMPSRMPVGKLVPKDSDALMIDLYRKLTLLPFDVEEMLDDDGELLGTNMSAKPYTLSREALTVWLRDWEIPMVKKEESEINPGMRSVLSKYIGFCGRVALILHLTKYMETLPPYEECRYTGRTIEPPKEISEETVRQAIVTMQFFIKQAEIIYGISSADPEDMTPAMLRLKEISIASAANGSEGWITPKIARQHTRLIRNADHAKALFAEMYESNFGELDTSGRTTKWRYVPGEDELSNPIAKKVEPPSIEELVDVYYQPPVLQNGNRTHDRPQPQERPKPEPEKPKPPKSAFEVGDVVEVLPESGIREATEAKERGEECLAIVCEVLPDGAVCVEIGDLPSRQVSQAHIKKLTFTRGSCWQP